MTFAVWFTALLAVFTFSSCLDDENGGQRQGSEIVKVVGMLGNYEFQSAGGFKLIPTNMSALTMDISTTFAFIAYQYDYAQINQTTKRVPITLTGIMPIKSNYTRPSLDGMKEFANAPIRSITTNGGYDAFPVSFWTPTTMFLPISYFIKDYGDNSALQKELDSHSFEIFFDVDDKEAYGDELVLHVRHHVADPSLNKERNVRINTNIYEVDLSMAVSMFEQKKGNKPNRITIKYEESYNGEYQENQLVQGTAEIDYQSILNAAKK